MKNDCFITGIAPFSTLDYPGSLSAVLFCQGCPWRCSYCHNRHLQPFAKSKISWGEILNFLQQRKGLLDAVVVSGGEPTSQKKLPQLLSTIQKMGFKTGLHTAGAFPETLASSLPFVNWVGMDLKAPFEQYEKITRTPHSGEQARKSVKAILESGVNHQFRTTLDPALLSSKDLDQIKEELARMGGKGLVIQTCREVRPR